MGVTEPEGAQTDDVQRTILPSYTTTADGSVEFNPSVSSSLRTGEKSMGHSESGDSAVDAKRTIQSVVDLRPRLAPLDVADRDLFGKEVYEKLKEKLPTTKNNHKTFCGFCGRLAERVWANHWKRYHQTQIAKKDLKRFMKPIPLTALNVQVTLPFLQPHSIATAENQPPAKMESQNKEKGPFERLKEDGSASAFAKMEVLKLHQSRHVNRCRVKALLADFERHIVWFEREAKIKRKKTRGRTGRTRDDIKMTIFRLLVEKLRVDRDRELSLPHLSECIRRVTDEQWTSAFNGKELGYLRRCFMKTVNHLDEETRKAVSKIQKCLELLMDRKANFYAEKKKRIAALEKKESETKKNQSSSGSPPTVAPTPTPLAAKARSPPPTQPQNSSDDSDDEASVKKQKRVVADSNVSEESDFFNSDRDDGPQNEDFDYPSHDETMKQETGEEEKEHDAKRTSPSQRPLTQKVVAASGMDNGQEQKTAVQEAAFSAKVEPEMKKKKTALKGKSGAESDQGSSDAPATESTLTVAANNKRQSTEKTNVGIEQQNAAPAADDEAENAVDVNLEQEELKNKEPPTEPVAFPTSITEKANPTEDTAPDAKRTLKNQNPDPQGGFTASGSDDGQKQVAVQETPSRAKAEPEKKKKIEEEEQKKKEEKASKAVNAAESDEDPGLHTPIGLGHTYYQLHKKPQILGKRRRGAPESDPISDTEEMIEDCPKISIGHQFQADLSDTIIPISPDEHYGDREYDELVWTPPKFDKEEKMEEFWEKSRTIYWRSIWRQFEGHIPFEMALQNLMNCGYRFEDALETIDEYLKKLPEMFKPVSQIQAVRLMKEGLDENKTIRYLREKAMPNYHLDDVHTFLFQFIRFYILQKHYGVPCVCHDHLCDELPNYVPRIACSNCTSNRVRTSSEAGISLESKGTSSESKNLHCLLCQTYRSLCGKDRPAQNLVLTTEEEGVLEKWRQKEQELRTKLSLEEVKVLMQKEKEERWKSLEFSDEELSILSVQGIKGNSVTKIPEALREFKLPLFTRCGCENGGIPTNLPPSIEGVQPVIKQRGIPWLPERESEDDHSREVRPLKKKTLH